jgi:hypothetical protein
MGSGCCFYLRIIWRRMVIFTPRLLYCRRERAPATCWIGWAGPRAGVDDMERWKFLTLLGPKLRPFGRLARSHSLYRLRYRGTVKYSYLLNVDSYLIVISFRGGSREPLFCSHVEWAREHWGWVCGTRGRGATDADHRVSTLSTATEKINIWIF